MQGGWLEDIWTRRVSTGDRDSVSFPERTTRACGPAALLHGRSAEAGVVGNSDESTFSLGPGEMHFLVSACITLCTCGIPV